MKHVICWLVGLAALGCASVRTIDHVSWWDTPQYTYFYVAYAEWDGGTLVASRLMRCTVNRDNSVSCVPEHDVDRLLSPNAPPASGTPSSPTTSTTAPVAPAPSAAPTAPPAAAPPPSVPPPAAPAPTATTPPAPAPAPAQ